MALQSASIRNCARVALLSILALGLVHGLPGEFYNDYLNSTVTLRDMLAHRTGITRHDSIWYQAPDSRRELFGKL